MLILIIILLLALGGALYAGKQNPVLMKFAIVPAVLAVCVIIYSFIPVAPPALEEVVALDKLMGLKFGELIKEDFPEGGVIAVFQLRPGDPDVVMQAIPDVQLEGIREGAGESFPVVSIDATQVGTPSETHLNGGYSRSAKDFKSMLDGIDDVVAVVSFVGLPVDVHNLKKVSSASFYVYFDDTLPSEWEGQLPAGVKALMSFRELDTQEMVESTTLTPSEKFDQKYLITLGGY